MPGVMNDRLGPWTQIQNFPIWHRFCRWHKMGVGDKWFIQPYLNNRSPTTCDVSRQCWWPIPDFVDMTWCLQTKIKMSPLICHQHRRANIMWYHLFSQKRNYFELRPLLILFVQIRQRHATFKRFFHVSKIQFKLKNIKNHERRDEKVT